MYSYVTRMYLYVTRMYLYVTRMYLYVTRMYSHVLVCYSYVLVYARMSLVCHPCGVLVTRNDSTCPVLGRPALQIRTSGPSAPMHQKVPQELSGG